ncbi:rubrerythrin family protein [Halosimplex pelagicum]|uniref:Rubrerythrin family protein n=1 Tax=Halosimplex pelagicum TaxID=869886 RepID=A0A7D5T4M3_9EURY|nr:rubrerythrin family protein [Halosimplex pelagicum]QLH81588.1 rubrerythrin family protein [Halosimplex pelagicum]
MNGQQLVEAVREAQATELDRLGSDKYLIAATGADLERAPVLRSVAESAASGRDTFSRWADEATGDAASAFQTAADTETAQFDRVVASLAELPNDDADAAATIDGTDAPLHAALADTDGTVERLAAGFVGRPLVADRTLLQAVNFFVNEADEERADLARELRSDAQGRLDEGVALLDSVCETDADWERAQRGAERVVEAAYEEYATALEAMGVDPKPVC